MSGRTAAGGRAEAPGDTWAWRALLATTVAVPLAFTPFTADVYMGVKVWLTVAGVAFVGAGVVVGQRRLPPWPRVAWAVVGLGAVSLLAAFVGRTPATSLAGAYQRYGGVSSLVVFVAFAALLVVCTWDRPERVATLQLFLAGTAVAAASYALLQRAGIDAFDVREASGANARYPGSTLGNSNFAGGFFAIALPCVVACAVRAADRRYRLVWSAAVAIVAGGLWASSSRGGMIAAAVGLAVAAIAGRHAITARLRPLTFVAGAVAVVLVGVGIGVIVRAGDDVPSSDLDVLRSQSAQARHFEWEAALDGIVDRPLLGNGPDSFAVVYPLERSAEDGASAGNIRADKPHNVFLERASDTGVLGIAAYLAVIGIVLVGAWRRARHVTGRDLVVLVAFVGSLGAYLTQALFSIDVPPLAWTGWMLVGALVALSDPEIVAARAAKPPTVKAARVSAARAAGPWAVAGIITLLAALPIAGDARLHFAENDDRDGDLEAAFDGYDAAAGLRPFEPEYRRASGFAAERLAAATDDRATKKHWFTIAMNRYQDALDRRPGNVFFLSDLGRVQALYAQQIDPKLYADADATLTDAVAADPHNWELRETHGVVLNAWANASGDTNVRRRAANEYEEVVALQPKHYSAWITLGRLRLALGDAAGAKEAADTAGILVPFTQDAAELWEAADALAAQG
ncbi:MAG TPA: O-antigen ligase family protein [Acidimicrobiia bacterium]|nr:O-antigen ligase family protein [Acidimicrobiia bacterium]